MSSHEVAEDRTLTHPQRRGNLYHRQSPLAQCRRPLRLSFRRPFLPPVIDALGLGHRGGVSNELIYDSDGSSICKTIDE